MRELGARVGLPRSTVHRICRTLSDEGVLIYDQDTKRYEWGPELMTIARAAFESSELRRIARQEMQVMVSEVNESAQLVVYDRDALSVFIADVVHCTHPVRYHPDLNVLMPAHSGATGKAILAFAALEDIDAVIAKGLESLTPRTITDPDALLRDLAAIAKAGVSISRGERTPGSVGIGAPIFQRDGSVIAAMTMTIPEYRSSEAAESQMRELVIKSAERISRALGLPPSVPYPRPAFTR
jgi:DNA-binding IclR family transcriptional regulator